VASELRKPVRVSLRPML